MKIIGDVGEIGLFGNLQILNVADGDTKLSFDPKNPAERARAAKIVKDMLRAGFAVMIEVDVNGEKLFRRVHDFDEATCEYIIFGGPDEQGTEETAGSAATPEPEPKKPRRGRPAKPAVHIPASSTRAVGIARSAGG